MKIRGAGGDWGDKLTFLDFYGVPQGHSPCLCNYGLFIVYLLAKLYWFCIIKVTPQRNKKNSPNVLECLTWKERFVMFYKVIGKGLLIYYFPKQNHVIFEQSYNNVGTRVYNFSFVAKVSKQN